MRKPLLALFLALLFLPLSGCWNYRSLDEMTIVSGVAIDKDEGSGNYRLSFEFVDVGSSKSEDGPDGKVFEAEGRTMFETVRNAKKKAQNKLYFGHTLVLILNQNLAKTEDLGVLLDWFMRDGECRETMLVAISQEATAAEILKAADLDQKIAGIKLQELMENDGKLTGSTVGTELYECFDSLNTPGKELTLAALHLNRNEDKPLYETNGIAAFQGSRLVGYLSPQEAKYYLAVTNQLEGGVIAFSIEGGGRERASLEIHKCETQQKVLRENDGPKLCLHISFITVLGEYMQPNTVLSEEKLTELEALAEQQIKADIDILIRRVQQELKTDIFGFGSLIHKKDNALWESLSACWEEEFPSVPIETEVCVCIIGTSSLSRT